MDTTAETNPGDGMQSVELIDLGPPDVVRVHSRRTRVTTVAIAAFTGLTCLGLASAVVAPGTLDRRFDPRADIAIASPQASVGRGLNVAPEANDTPPVVVTSASASSSGRAAPVIHVSGAAFASVEEVEVRLLISGRALGRAVTHVDTSRPGVVGSEGAAGIGLWTVDLAIPRGVAAERLDGMAVVEVRWMGSSGGGGPVAVVVALGDGRRRS